MIYGPEERGNGAVTVNQRTDRGHREPQNLEPTLERLLAHLADDHRVARLPRESGAASVALISTVVPNCLEGQKI